MTFFSQNKRPTVKNWHFLFDISFSNVTTTPCPMGSPTRGIYRRMNLCETYDRGMIQALRIKQRAIILYQMREGHVFILRL